MNILSDFAFGDFVGWVERSEAHHVARRNLVGLTPFDPPYRKSPYRKLPRRTGFSLIELLIVVALLSILAAAAIISSSPSAGGQLRAAAHTVAEDVAYARSLGVTYNSKYTLSFDAAANRYTLKHTGADATLDVLPAGVRIEYSNSTSEHVVDLDDTPNLTGGVRLVGVRTAGTTPTTVTTLEFGPLGETSRSEPTVVWLMIGVGDGLRFISVEVDPVTGLTTIGSVQGTPPSGLVLPADVAAT